MDTFLLLEARSQAIHEYWDFAADLYVTCQSSLVPSQEPESQRWKGSTCEVAMVVNKQQLLQGEQSPGAACQQQLL